MDARLLVIGGYATSGKDAVANVLVGELGWYKTYMSKPLEKALLILDPYIVANVEEQGIGVRYSTIHSTVGYDESKKILEVRRLLQTLGTEIGRNMFGENSWLDIVREETFQKNFREGRNVVVTGVRYVNELDVFKAIGASSLWVERPGIIAVNTHSSDNTLDAKVFDTTMYNDGTLEDLKNKVISLFKE